MLQIASERNVIVFLTLYLFATLCNYAAYTPACLKPIVFQHTCKLPSLLHKQFLRIRILFEPFSHLLTWYSLLSCSISLYCSIFCIATWAAEFDCYVNVTKGGQVDWEPYLVSICFSIFDNISHMVDLVFSTLQDCLQIWHMLYISL